MKKFWEKYRVAIIVVGLIALFVGFSFLLEEESAPVEISDGIDAWVETTKKEEYTLTVIAQTGCYYCNQFSPIFESVESKYDGINYYWYHADEMESSEYSILTSTYDISDKYKGTPFTMLTYNGELVDYISGYVPEETLVEFLKENKVISE